MAIPAGPYQVKGAGIPVALLILVALAIVALPLDGRLWTQRWHSHWKCLSQEDFARNGQRLTAHIPAAHAKTCQAGANLGMMCSVGGEFGVGQVRKECVELREA